MSRFLIAIKTMIDVEAYIEARIKELAEPVISDDLATHPSQQDGCDAIINRGRGRPHASQSRNERTRDSYDASVFVLSEMNVFRERGGIQTRYDTPVSEKKFKPPNYA